MHFLVKILVLACLAGYFENVCSSLETLAEFEEDPYVGAITGSVTDRNGNVCDYVELRKPGGGPRILSMDCKKPGDGDAYACEYKGNPHNCRWYNKHQAEFYRHMAQDLAKQARGACSVSQIESRDCPGVIFKKY